MIDETTRMAVINALRRMGVVMEWLGVVVFVSTVFGMLWITALQQSGMLPLTAPPPWAWIGLAAGATLAIPGVLILAVFD